MLATQYDEDLRTIEPIGSVAVILRDDDVLVYATWTGRAWSVFKLDIALGTCQTSVAEYASANESRQAHVAGAIIYGRVK